MFDFKCYPVVDAHAHPFMPSRQNPIYGRRYILSSNRYRTVPEEDIRSTLAYRMILLELARLFDLPKNSPDEVIIAARDAMSGKDYKAYVEMLFQDAGIRAFLSESGFPIQGERLRTEEVKAFEEATASIQVREILRLEMICNHLVADASQPMLFDEFLEMFHRHVEERIQNGGVVALKTTIGYFSGLEILDPSPKEAEISYYAHYYGGQSERHIQKAFRDFMVYRWVDLCAKHGLPLQVHTGAGDPPSCDLRLMNPALLYQFLNRKDTGAIPIVLLHGGYPFVEEMAFMVNGYANVWTDVSSMTADDSIAVERALPILLEKIPLTRLMYGSDGAGDVDPIWFAAVNFKKVLARVMQMLVERGVITDSWAEQAASWILSENAIRFYRLSSK